MQNTNLSLVAALPAQNGVARAKFHAHTRGQARATDIALSISSLLQNKAAVVPGTLSIVPKGKFADVTCVLRAVRPIRQVELDADGRAPGFTMLSKNLYMDAKDQTAWAVRKDGDRITLVRQGDLESDAALDQIMTAMTSTSSARTKATNDLIDTVHGVAQSVGLGVLVSYLQADTKIHRLGFSLSSFEDDHIEVVPMAGQVERVHSSQLIHAFNAAEYQADRLKLPKSISTSAAYTKKDLIDYYRNLFAYNDAYMARFEAMILRSGV